MRRGLWAAAWLAGTFASFSCAKFTAGADPGVDGGADDAGAADGAGLACIEACAPNGSCRSYDFTNGCGNWAFTGDLGKAGVVGECMDGALHVAAINTLDVTANVDVEVPSTAEEIHVSGTITIAAWMGDLGDKPPLFGLQTSAGRVAYLVPTEQADGRFSLDLCTPDADGGAACTTSSARAAKNDPHSYKIELSNTAATLYTDCIQTATETVAPALTIGGGGKVAIFFGAMNGYPIDGTLRDVVITFK